MVKACPRHLVFVLLASLLSACGGGGGTAASSGGSGVTGRFLGLEKLDLTDNSYWTLRWKAVGSDEISYFVYKRSLEEQFDFKKPYGQSRSDYFSYRPPRSVYVDTSVCFLVRVASLAADKNTVEKCSEPPVFTSSGAELLEQQGDGSFILKWTADIIDGITFNIFEREDGTEHDFTTPSYGNIKLNFYQLPAIPRGKKFCYVVRYSHSDLQADENTTEVCNTLEAPIVFTGINQIERLSGTSARIKWTKSPTAGVVKYRVYKGSDFKEIVAEVAATEALADLTGLASGTQLTFAVRAVDDYGREDTNFAVLPTVL